MSIPKALLASTDFRAPGICIYGPAGMKKTHGICTLPPPIEMHDFEGGSASVLPWIARSREYNVPTWTVITQEQREQYMNMLTDKVRETVTLKPAPYIDVIHYNNYQWASWDTFVLNIGNFNYDYYSAIAIDSLQEFSATTQTYSKGREGADKLMTEIPFAWSQAQERAIIQVRRLKNFRNAGIFVYLTGSEDIAKDYVNNPMEKRAPGTPAPEPYSIRGTVNLPGKLSEGLCHVPDILCHARLMSGNPTWITAPEALPGGSAHWDAKDRYGRLDFAIRPNVRTICEMLYGKEGKAAIYAHALKGTTAQADSD